MTTYEDWCKHYDYDPKTPEAQDDYKKYCDNLELFRKAKGVEASLYDPDGPAGFDCEHDPKDRMESAGGGYHCDACGAPMPGTE